MEKITNEIWKDIVNYENIYQVSNLGRIRDAKSKIIKSQHLHKDGYFLITLYKDSTKLTCRVHRLVAQAFIPNPHKLPEINHISGIKMDNRVCNLEWVSSRDNIKHAWGIGIYSKSILQRAQLKKMKPVIQYQGKSIKKIYRSEHNAAKDMGVSVQSIVAAIKNGFSCCGYQWRFFERSLLWEN